MCVCVRERERGREGGENSEGSSYNIHEIKNFPYCGDKQTLIQRYEGMWGGRGKRRENYEVCGGKVQRGRDGQY